MFGYTYLLEDVLLGRCQSKSLAESRSGGCRSFCYLFWLSGVLNDVGYKILKLQNQGFETTFIRYDEAPNILSLFADNVF